MAKPINKRPAAKATKPGEFAHDSGNGQAGNSVNTPAVGHATKGGGSQNYRKAAVKRQFDEADRKGEPSEAEIAEATMSRSIRGW